MSRIGKAPIEIPGNVEVAVASNNVLSVKGPKGKLSQRIDPDISLKVENGQLSVERPTNQPRHRAMHGLYRALAAGMVEGVTQGFVKEMEVVGVGYRITNTGNLLELVIGYSHPIMFEVPSEVKLTTETVKGQPPLIRLEGIDKQLLGQIAAKIRSFRKPEPYKGKGIKFKGEILRRKAGKTGGKK